jgi:5-methylthioadenosine/S-adenosylhomocysteine deaminase
MPKATPSQHTAYTLVLTNADFVIEDADRWHQDADVVVRSNEIVEIRNRSAPVTPGDERIIDCAGMLLMPGLVNAHTHLFQVLTRGLGKSLGVRTWASTVTYPVARELAASDFYFAALLASADAIRNGCTAMVDHPTHFARFHADESCRALKTAGLRGAVARGGSDFSLVDDGEVRLLHEDLEQTASFLSRWSGDRLVKAWVGPSGFHSCSAKGLAALKQLARTTGSRFHMHLAESAAGRAEARQAGFLGEMHWATELGLLDEETSLAHAIWVSEEELLLLARSGCQVAHCASSNQLLGSGIAPLSQMLALGVPVAIATDGASSNDSLDMIAEMKAALLLARVSNLRPDAIAPRDVFYAATEGGARLLGHDRLGKLAPHYAADIIGIRVRENPSLTPLNDPLAMVVLCASGRDVTFVMVDGVVLFHNGAFISLDVHEAINEVESTAARLGLCNVSERRR